MNALRTLVATVGYRNLSDFSVGPALLPALQVLRPLGVNLLVFFGALYAILVDRERPYYEHRLAA